VHAQESNDTEAIKEKTVDTIDDKFKDFFKNVASHRKNGEDGPSDALKGLNLGGKGTTIN